MVHVLEVRGDEHRDGGVSGPQAREGRIKKEEGRRKTQATGGGETNKLPVVRAVMLSGAKHL